MSGLSASEILSIVLRPLGLAGKVASNRAGISQLSPNDQQAKATADTPLWRATPSLLGMAQIEAELSALLGGGRVDLRTAGDLSRYFRDEVVSGAEALYVAT